MVTTKQASKSDKLSATDEQSIQQVGADESAAQMQQSGDRARGADREQGAEESNAFTVDLMDSWFKP